MRRMLARCPLTCSSPSRSYVVAMALRRCPCLAPLCQLKEAAGAVIRQQNTTEAQQILFGCCRTRTEARKSNLAVDRAHSKAASLRESAKGFLQEKEKRNWQCFTKNLSSRSPFRPVNACTKLQAVPVHSRPIHSDRIWSMAATTNYFAAKTARAGPLPCRRQAAAMLSQH